MDNEKDIAKSFTRKSAAFNKVSNYLDSLREKKNSHWYSHQIIELFDSSYLDE